MIGVLIFVSVLVPDITSIQLNRPLDRIGIPGGKGLLDGLFIKPATGIIFTWFIYRLKIARFLDFSKNKFSRYDDESKEYLLNLNYSFRRPVDTKTGLTYANRDQSDN